MIIGEFDDRGRPYVEGRVIKIPRLNHQWDRTIPVGHGS